LLLAADGTKLGKTTGARIWLDPARTSPHELFQHFVQTDDRQVRQQLLWLTLLPVEQIDAAMARHEQAPQHRDAQRLLAREVVTLVHGAAEADGAERGMAAWRHDLSPEHFETLEASLPTTVIDALPARLVDLLVHTELAASKSAAVRLVRQGGASLNDQRVDDSERLVTEDDFVAGRWLLLGAGKKQRHLVVRPTSG
jgi:tyrosyl-tRNA synthetase